MAKEKTIGSKTYRIAEDGMFYLVQEKKVSWFDDEERYSWETLVRNGVTYAFRDLDDAFKAFWAIQKHGYKLKVIELD